MQTTNEKTHSLQTGELLQLVPWVKAARSPITSDKFRLLFKRANSEWKGILMLGRYCGLGLIDCARLRRLNLTADRSGLRLFAGPNRRIRKVPLGPRLTSYLRALSLGPSHAPLFPYLCGKTVEELEAEFKAHVTIAGLGYAKAPCFCSIYFQMPRCLQAITK